MMQTISATELARNTRQILDKIVNLRETVTIERNQRVTAQIVPLLRQMTAAQALAGLMTRPPLTPLQARQWLAAS